MLGDVHLIPPGHANAGIYGFCLFFSKNKGNPAHIDTPELLQKRIIFSVCHLFFVLSFLELN